MEIILFILQFSIIAFLIYRWKKYLPEGITALLCIALLLLKCICGIGYYFLCVHYYSGSADLFQCMNEVAIINDHIKHHPFSIPDLFSRVVPIAGLEQWNNTSYNYFYNDNRTLIFLNSIIMFLSGGFISIHVLWMNVISVIGLLFIYDAMHSGKQTSYRKYLPFLFPTVMIFGSSILKEPILILAIGFMLLTLKKMQENLNYKSLMLLTIAMVLFLLIKIYLLIFFLPGILALFILKYNKWNASGTILSIYLICFILVLTAGEVNPAIDLPHKLAGQQLNNIRNAVFSGAQSFISPVLFAPTISSFLKRIPEAAAFGFFRPFPWELKEWWMIPVALEPVIVLLILIRQMIKRNLLVIFNSPIHLLLIIVSLLLITLIGFITPVAGNLVRLRMPAMLLLMISVVSVEKK